MAGAPELVVAAVLPPTLVEPWDKYKTDLAKEKALARTCGTALA